MSAVDDLLGDFDSVSLEELDGRASLLQRIDNKYAADQQRFREVLRELRADHEVLEIDSLRIFSYLSTYFETPDLRCFTDHVEGRIPRFKTRTRLYEDTEQCVFEIKLKRSEDETDKRQIDYRAEQREHLTESARRCLEEALGDIGLEVAKDLKPHLTTSFRRITLGARGGSERLTCDLGIKLSAVNGSSVTIEDDLVLIETKTEAGDSKADRELTSAGLEPISLSKYRVGMSLVGEASGFGPQPGSELFG